jgi:BlaI family penicillinase repressor
MTKEARVARSKDIQLTRFELEIMDALWNLGSASIREIHEALPEKKRPAYTTVQTMIRRLEEKGAVHQVKKISNAHIFEPLISREAAHRRWVNGLLSLFGGSARPLMAHLAEAGKPSLEDIREVERLLTESEPSPESQTPGQKTARPRRAPKA